MAIVILLLPTGTALSHVGGAAIGEPHQHEILTGIAAPGSTRIVFDAASMDNAMDGFYLVIGGTCNGDSRVRVLDRWTL